MNECANSKAIGGVRCSVEIYNSHEGGRGSAAPATVAVAARIEEREIAVCYIVAAAAAPTVEWINRSSLV